MLSCWAAMMVARTFFFKSIVALYRKLSKSPAMTLSTQDVSHASFSLKSAGMSVPPLRW